jgi:predicted phosphodiesterase
MVAVSRKKVETERALFLGDWHVPYQDMIAVELAFSFMEWFGPDTIFLIGDFQDFYSVSRFDIDPERIQSLQHELDVGRGILKRLRRAAPDARIVYLSGNHEHRLTKFLWAHPKISGLRNLQLPSLLGLEELEIEYHTYHEQLNWYGLLVEHGDRASKKSAYTAAAMMDARGVSGITGHTHRLGAHFRSDNAGNKVWYENGCLCRLDAEYVIGKPNWQHGFSVGFGLSGRTRFIVEQVPILSGRLFYNGQLWEAKVGGKAKR